MIKLKKCGLVFIFMVLFLPMVVLGDTKKDVKSLFTKDEDGKFYLQTNIVDPDIIIGDQCLFTIKDYNDDLMHGDVSFEDWFKEYTSDCKSYFYADILNIYFKHLGFEENPIYFNYNNPQKDKGFINENGIEYEINISYLDNYDQKEFKKANNIFNGFDKKEDIYGLNLINLVYHYGDIFDFQVVKDGATLNIGQRNLVFAMMTMLHWPDSMATYCTEDKILFSNDAFGEHYATSKRYDDEVDEADLFYEAKKYFQQNFMGIKLNGDKGFGFIPPKTFLLF